MKLKGKVLTAAGVVAVAAALSITGASMASADEGTTGSTYTKPTLQSIGTFKYNAGDEAQNIIIASEDIKNINDSVEALNNKVDASVQDISATTQEVVNGLDQIKYKYTKDSGTNKGTLRLSPARSHSDN